MMCMAHHTCNPFCIMLQFATRGQAVRRLCCSVWRYLALRGLRENPGPTVTSTSAFASRSALSCRAFSSSALRLSPSACSRQTADSHTKCWLDGTEDSSHWGNALQSPMEPGAGPSHRIPHLQPLVEIVQLCLADQLAPSAGLKLLQQRLLLGLPVGQVCGGEGQELLRP